MTNKQGASLHTFNRPAVADLQLSVNDLKIDKEAGNMYLHLLMPNPIYGEYEFFYSITLKLAENGKFVYEVAFNGRSSSGSTVVVIMAKSTEGSGHALELAKQEFSSKVAARVQDHTGQWRDIWRQSKSNMVK